MYMYSQAMMVWKEAKNKERVKKWAGLGTV